MSKQTTLKTLKEISFVINEVATGSIKLEDVQAAMMLASDNLDEAIGDIETNLIDTPTATVS